MITIYQLFPRLFGNRSTSLKHNGSIEENGCGKFDDITMTALQAIHDLGITHIWLTGVIRHATLTDYSSFGIPPSHPAVVKGRAGSPYAITDYYDVDPDLANDVSQRINEFVSLVDRIHQAGMKVILDFVPNHLAREYRSVNLPAGQRDFGADDDQTQAFHPQNNFYYIPGQSFVPPYREESLYHSQQAYTEQPAKVTGNDCFSAMPGIHDWFETVKLNYGVDIRNDWQKYFSPVPDTWHKMDAILHFWASKGVDGFRADMAGMVPVEFWAWAIARLKASFPQILMIAEIYEPALYRDFVKAGFDFLYDKVGLYNRLHDVLLYGQSVEPLTQVLQSTAAVQHRMLRFMENHDEPRLASPRFYGFPFHALPAVALSAWLHPGAFMIYNGQESGETALGSPGFSGDDGRTSIFDYCHMPQHQQWMAGGSFDGSAYFYDQKKLREAYRTILRLRNERPALREGAFYDLMWANPWYTDFDPWNVFVFLRYTNEEKLLIVINFNRMEHRSMRINMHEDALALLGMAEKSEAQWMASDLIETRKKLEFRPADLPEKGLPISLRPSQYAVFVLTEIKPENL